MTYPTPWIGFGLALGGLSHLFLDGFNQSRQWWAWPFSHRGFRWPLHAPVKRTDAPTSLLLTICGIWLAWHVGHLPAYHFLPHIAALGPRLLRR